MSKKLIDLTDKKFGSLTVLERVGSTRQKSSTWKCLCECGEEVIYSSDHLTRKTCPVKSCGCKRYRKGKDHQQWNGHEGISGGWWANRILRERTQTTRAKIPVEITKEYAWDLFLKQDKKCALTGIGLQISNNYPNNTASIDRIDSSKGYIEGNIQWVHKHINFMKRTYSQDYFIEMCTKVANNFKDKSGGVCEFTGN